MDYKNKQKNINEEDMTSESSHEEKKLKREDEALSIDEDKTSKRSRKRKKTNKKVAWSEGDKALSINEEDKTSKRSRKKKKTNKKVAWSEGDEMLRQALVNNAEKYAEARQKLLSIPGTSVIGDVQYGMSLLYEQYKADTWPDRFKAKYDLSRAESPTKEALDAARYLEEHSNLAAVLHQQHNYDFDWALHEASRILAKAIGEEYNEKDSSGDDQA